MTTSKWRGHNIQFIFDYWIYSDTKQKVSENKNRSCGYCNRENTKEGHDGCIGELPDVLNACCGHGISSEAYVQFCDGTDIRGEKAVEYIKEELKNE